jgi:hypothetical protein
MHIFTPEGVEIGAMEPFKPHSHVGRIFVITLDPVDKA